MVVASLYLISILFVIVSTIIYKITKNESLNRKTGLIFMILIIICNFIFMIFSFIEKSHVTVSVALAMSNLMIFLRCKKDYKSLKNSSEKTT